MSSLQSAWDVLDSAGRMLNARGHDLPLVVAAALAALGLSVAVVGGRPPLLRVVGLAGGLVLGAWLGQNVASLAHLPLNDEARTYLLEGGGALLGALWPAGLLFAASGIAVGRFGAMLSPKLPEPIFWFLSLIAASFSLIFFRPLAALLTAMAGGAAFVFGLSALLPGSDLRDWWFVNSWAAAALAAAVALAGFMSQLTTLRRRSRPGPHTYAPDPARST
jgi:hypothetical protein